jgi:endoglucanase
MLNRRELMRRSLTTAAAAMALPVTAGAATALPEPTPEKLPRWRGFNLLNKFMVHSNKPFEEKDFADIAELGFDFVRLPLDYRCWTDPARPTALDEKVLAEIDQAVAFGRKYNIHVQLNLHRAPGFTVASPPEPKSVWSDRDTLNNCAYQWASFAGRYASVPNANLSFNPFNEPTNKVDPKDHRRVLDTVCTAIRRYDPERLIVCDGRDWARTPPTELLGLGVAGAWHSYEPMPVTHYKASWANWNESWPKPEWPLKLKDGKTVDRESLKRDLIDPWKAIEAKGMGVMVGEFGCHNQTPHPVVLAWMKDTLGVINEAGWGWALWNFTGSFGVMDSGRDDVKYESWHGRKVDRAMLDLLQAS